jgi:hypothetical protein
MRFKFFFQRLILMLEQIQIRYAPIDDRLEINFANAEGLLTRLHITRRLAHHWLVQMARLVEVSAQASEASDPVLRRTLAAAHHEATASRAKLGRSFNADPVKVLGVQPELVTEVQCAQGTSPSEPPLWQITFVTLADEKVTLKLDAVPFHGLFKLLGRKVVQAGWGLPTSSSTAQ